MSPAKPIVFVYHSFGSYTLAAYCRLFKNERVIGLIDAGGVPIRFYEAIKETFRSEYGISLEYIQ
jgi:predicted alpha/beta hydrolase family esterase